MSIPTIIPPVVPTRVTEQPILVKVRRGYELSIICDDGIRYLLRDLAKTIKVSAEALRARFARMHWSNPELLAPNRFKGFRPGKIKALAPIRRGASQFARLNTRSRQHNLDKLARPGLLERCL